MDTTLIVTSLIELLVSCVLGVVATVVSVKVFARFTRKFDEFQAIKDNNIAVGILLGSVLLASGLIVKEAMGPMGTTLQAVVFDGLTGATIAKGVGVLVLHVILAVVLVAVSVNLAAKLVMWVTKGIDELEAIRENNIAVAIAFGAMLVVIAMILAPGIRSLLMALIPYAEVSQLELPS